MPISKKPSLSGAPVNSSVASLRRVLILSTLLGACGGQAHPGADFEPKHSSVAPSKKTAPVSTVLPYFHRSTPLVASSAVPTPEPKETLSQLKEIVPPCPQEMVNIADEYCIDRHEVTLFDTEKGRELSPYYPPEIEIARMSYRSWKHSFFRKGTSFSKRTRPPKLPEWQLNEDYSYKARSVAGVIPSGYLSGLTAVEACTNAGKRLCQAKEWKKACKGEDEGNQINMKQGRVFFQDN